MDRETDFRSEADVEYMIRHTGSKTVEPGHRNEDYEGLQEGGMAA